MIPIVKAVQEQNKIISDLEKESANKTEEITFLKTVLEGQKSRIDKLYQLIEKQIYNKISFNYLIVFFQQFTPYYC